MAAANSGPPLSLVAGEPPERVGERDRDGEQGEISMKLESGVRVLVGMR